MPGALIGKKLRHPDCGIILTGEFIQRRDMFLRTQYGFVQLVRGCANLLWKELL